MTRTLLPDTGIVIGFRYKGSATLIEGPSRRLLPDGAVTGLRASVRQMHTSANGGIVLAKFRAAGAVSFVAEPLHHLFGLTCALEELFDHDAAMRTSRRIRRAGSDLERVAIFEQFLLAHYRPTSPDPIVGGALRGIDATTGAGRVRSIALALRVSQDTLEKRFRRVVGATPKQFSSIVRLRRAVGSPEPRGADRDAGARRRLLRPVTFHPRLSGSDRRCACTFPSKGRVLLNDLPCIRLRRVLCPGVELPVE